MAQQVSPMTTERTTCYMILTSKTLRLHELPLHSNAIDNVMLLTFNSHWIGIDMADPKSESARDVNRFKSYEYQPLDEEKKEIRLLRVPRRTAQSDKIEYTLANVSLQDSPPFVALSYCWGDASFQHEIMVNGHQMHITESLATAMKSLQSDEADVMLWADAISINQQDLVEKTKQVQLMRDIYRTASRVIIWLGPSTSETYYTMREMRKLGDKLIEAGLWDLSSEEILDWDFGDQEQSEACSTKRAILSLKAEHLAQARNDEYPFWWIMSDLGKRPWFHASETIPAQIATCLLIFTENMVHPRMHKCPGRNIQVWR